MTDHVPTGQNPLACKVALVLSQIYCTRESGVGVPLRVTKPCLLQRWFQDPPMALHADFKSRGGLQSLFNAKAGKKVFAASFESVLPDAAPATSRSKPPASTSGKFALPPLQASQRQAASRDPSKSGVEETLQESQGFSQAFQHAVNSLVQEKQDVAKPLGQGTDLEAQLEAPEQHVASDVPDTGMPAEASIPLEPRPPEQKGPDARMRRVLARTRLPGKQPEGIEDIQNIEIFAERLVDAFGSLTKAFEAFDSHNRSEVTRSQFDAALDAMGLDVGELCGIPSSKLFSLVSRASKKPIGALTEQAWMSFFKKYLGKTASARLLEADYSIEAALSNLAQLHSLQPARDPRHQDDQAWGHRAAKPPARISWL